MPLEDSIRTHLLARIAACVRLQELPPGVLERLRLKGSAQLAINLCRLHDHLSKQPSQCPAQTVDGLASALVQVLVPDGLILSAERRHDLVVVFLSPARLIDMVLNEIRLFCDPSTAYLVTPPSLRFPTLPAGTSFLVSYSVPFGRKPTGTDLRGWITANYCARALRAMGYSVVCEPRCEIWSADTEVLLAELDQPMASAPSTTDPSTESSTALHNVVIPSASVEPTQRPAGKYLRRLFHGDVQTRMHWEHLWSRWKDETQAIFCAYNLSLSIEADALAHSHATVQSRLEQLPDVFQHESKLILDMTTHGLGRMVLRDSANDIDDAASFQFAADVAQLLDQQSKASRRVHLCEHSKEYYWKQCAKAADLFSKYHKSTTLAPLARTLNDAVAAAPSTPRALPSHVAFASLAQFDHPTTAADGLFGCLERASKHMFGICMDRTYDDIDATNSGRESDSVRDAVGGLSQISRLSESLGLSVIVMQILSFKRSRSVKFEWTELLDHDGSSGVYCQYTHARLCGIERYCGVAVDLDADLEPLAQSPEALALALLLAQYPKIFIQGIFNMEASSLAAFLVNVASQVSSCNYGMRIKGQTQAVAQARLRVLGAAKAVLRHGLEVLGLDAVVEM